jgi:hypothetical protein
MAPADARNRQTGTPTPKAVSVLRGAAGTPRSYILAAILVPAVLLAVVAWWLWGTVQSEARRRAERMSSGMTEHARRVLDAYATALEASLARAHGLSPDAIAANPRIHEFLARLQQHANAPTSFRLVRLSDGRVLSSSSGHPPAQVDLSEHDFLHAHRRKGPTTYIGGIVEAPITGEAGFSISRRDPQGEIIAVSTVPVTPLVREVAQRSPADRQPSAAGVRVHALSEP